MKDRRTFSLSELTANKHTKVVLLEEKDYKVIREVQIKKISRRYTARFSVVPGCFAGMSKLFQNTILINFSFLIYMLINTKMLSI